MHFPYHSICYISWKISDSLYTFFISVQYQVLWEWMYSWDNRTWNNHSRYFNHAVVFLIAAEWILVNPHQSLLLSHWSSLLPCTHINLNLSHTAFYFSLKLRLNVPYIVKCLNCCYKRLSDGKEPIISCIISVTILLNGLKCSHPLSHTISHTSQKSFLHSCTPIHCQVLKRHKGAA